MSLFPARLLVLVSLHCLSSFHTSLRGPGYTLLGGSHCSLLIFTLSLPTLQRAILRPFPFILYSPPSFTYQGGVASSIGHCSFPDYNALGDLDSLLANPQSYGSAKQVGCTDDARRALEGLVSLSEGKSSYSEEWGGFSLMYMLCLQWPKRVVIKYSC